MELYGSDRSPSAASSDSSSSSSSSSSSTNSSASSSLVNHRPSSCRNNTTNNSSIRDLDELLLGGNDLDALPFEFGCDFSAAFEDKYIVPPLSVSSTSRLRLAATGAESGFDVLPPLTASLLSPPTHFHLCSPPSRFLHSDLHEHLKAIHYSRRNSNTGMSVLSFDRKLEAVASRCSSAASQSTLSEPMSASTAASRTSTPDMSESGDHASARGAKSTHIGRWTKKEHELFLEGLKLFGKSWKKISSLVVTRTLVQIRTHAQKYLQKQAKNAQKAAAAAASADEAAHPSKSSRERLGQNSGEHLLDTWKGVPISFPDLLAAHPGSSSSSSSSSIGLYQRTAVPSSYVLATIGKRRNSSSGMCRLDQLLQDEPSQYAAMDGYYQSPMGTDDEIIQQPMYAPWARSDSHDSSSSSSMLSLPAKRRRLDPLQQLVNPMDAMSSSTTADAPSHQHHLVSMLALGAHQQHANNSLYGDMDFSSAPHQLQQHAYAASATQFVDSAEHDTSAASSTGSSSSSWQLS